MDAHGPHDKETRLAIGELTPPQAESALHEALLEFPDNRLLIDLCGEYDRNLADIERETGVQIVRRGNQLAILGEAEAAARRSARPKRPKRWKKPCAPGLSPMRWRICRACRG